MAYLEIQNLYKNRDILLFKQCYVLEKIHGTSSHISFDIFIDKKETSVFDAELNGIYCRVHYFSGGEKYENFIKLFDSKNLAQKYLELAINSKMIVYGESYGGKQQGMSATYGKELKFIAFEVKIDDNWLSVPKAEEIVKQFNLEFVHYDLVDTDIKLLNKLAEAPSIQAKRNGILEDKLREGIVLRPLIELRKNNNERIIAKHKNDKFKETKTTRKLDAKELEILTEADKIAEEWATEMRLSHILGKMQSYNIENTAEVIKAMLEDISKEAKNEIIESKASRKAISKKCAIMFKQRLKK